MKIGDKVRFLSEVGGGTVSGFQGKNIVLVEDEDGFEIPMLKQDVVVVGNEEYDIDALAADVCMSRSTLYRKLHSLTGQKPSLFIRAIRLKHAARMIKEGSYNLTEISTLCGFSSPSYFSRCFKAQYGIPPGSYCSS